MAETSKDRTKQRPPQGDLQRQRPGRDQPQKPAASKQPQPGRDLERTKQGQPSRPDPSRDPNNDKLGPSGNLDDDDGDDDRITQRYPAQGRLDQDT